MSWHKKTSADRAFVGCDGCSDLDPQHGFYPNDRGHTRLTVPPEARPELLRRLVELNAALISQG